MNILILYKDKTYKVISEKKINSIDLSDSKIKRIFIPLYDNPNAYIPIKPSSLYKFNKVKVSIAYQAFIYDMEDSIGTSFTPHLFEKECDNLIDFINAIYNCYKFRGVTLYLDTHNAMTYDRTMSFVIALRQVQIQFFNKCNQLINEIDSGLMKDLEEYSKKVFHRTPPPYICENRLNSLKDIFYIPEMLNGEMADSERLHLAISIKDDNTWQQVKKPGKELSPHDYLFYKIRDFEIYYLMPYELFTTLLNFKAFTIDYLSVPVTLPYDEDFLTSLDNNKIPSVIEKQDAMSSHFNSDLFSVSNVSVDVHSIDILLESMIFFKSIVSYIKYFGVFCYAEEDKSTKMRNFNIFYRPHICGEYSNEFLLTELELDDDTILNTFLKMIKGR